MKTSLVPAQITTVEDKIAGNLTLQQMLLLIAPVFIDIGIYVVFPHSFKLNTFKIVLVVLVAILCSMLAIRIKDKILLLWLTTLYRYYTRPRYFIFNKNDGYLRHEHSFELATKNEEGSFVEQQPAIQLPALSTDDVVRIESMLTNPAAQLSFISQKDGGFYVSITEAK